MPDVRARKRMADARCQSEKAVACCQHGPSLLTSDISHLTSAFLGVGHLRLCRSRVCRS